MSRGLVSTASVRSLTWEQLQVDGRVVISQVLAAIDASDMCVFDVTFPNPNVLFEAGYAIGRGRPVWLTLDSTVASAKHAWRELSIAGEIGYTPYRNSGDFLSRFAREDPLNTLEPLHDTLIEAVLPDGATAHDTLLFCTTFEPFEAANRLNNFVDSRQRLGTRVALADPSESSLLPLRWYLGELARSAGVLVHFAGENRNRAAVHNNRHAFVAGLAVGLEIPALLLAESDYRAPFDFEQQLRVYETSEECVEESREWLERLTFDRTRTAPTRAAKRSRLTGIRFGEHVAENERSELTDYFIETSAYGEVVATRDSIFIGHRGTGKTANALQAFEAVAANKTNLAILIKPPGFEFPAIMAVVDRLPAYQHDYFFDALWRFVIQTEIASAVVSRLEARPSGVPYSEDEESFLQYVRGEAFDIRADVSVRLAQALDALVDWLGDTPNGDQSRNHINEAFHSQSLAVLRSQLGNVLRDRKRVAVFVDNLDKGWERGSDFGVMARFILGLLTARGHVVTDFQKQDYWRNSIKLTVAIFLRSDIYAYLRREAREPDKLPISSVVWRDWESLRTVIETRFLFSGASADSADSLWDDYFCREVDGEQLPTFLARITLPRPRDIVYLCNAAIGRAIDRGHETVSPEDFKAARETYSQYAYEALLVENGVTIPEMEEALLAFVGTSSIATRASRRDALMTAGISNADLPRILDKLIAMSFFGLETAQGSFVFPEVGTETARVLAQVRLTEPDETQQRLLIHPAFHTFLGIH